MIPESHVGVSRLPELILHLCKFLKLWSDMVQTIKSVQYGIDLIRSLRWFTSTALYVYVGGHITLMCQRSKNIVP